MGENVENGVYPTRKALEIAESLELDLVEISPNATPPVCKVIDYKKFLYEQKKRDKELKAKAVKVVIKEIRFGPQTDDHDYEFKKKHGEKFLKEGERILIIDDFLAEGKAVRGLIDVINQAGAIIEGVGIVIEKGFQTGGKDLRGLGLNVQSLCIIESMENGKLQFKEV